MIYQEQIQEAVNKVSPNCVGMSFDKDNKVIRLDFADKATEEEKKLAQEVVDNFKYDSTEEKTEIEVLKDRITVLEGKITAIETKT
jgi:phage shock protein A